MTIYLIDASALLAVMREEPGADAALARMTTSYMSAVNISEALMRGEEKGVPVESARAFIAAQGIQVLVFDADLAVEAALLRRATRHLGLSFADRACLATAIRHRATVVTADRAWATLDLPCPIELIR